MRTIAVVLLFLSPLFCMSQKQRVWIDTDIMIGKFPRDVDDGLALILALSDTNIHIAGISFVHGVDYASEVTEILLKRYGRGLEIPTFKGADDSVQFGDETEATQALRKALQEGPLTILALGPMTNIGTVLENHPELASNVTRISYCAGRRPGQLFNPGSGKTRFSDYNFDLDPYATAMVLKAGVPMLLAGYDCSDDLFVSKEDFVHLRKSENATDKWLYRKLRSWHSLWRTFIGSKQGFIPFDVSTVGALLYPQEFDITPAIPSYIQVLKNDSKHIVKTPTKPYLIVLDNAAGRIVSYCNSTNSEFKTRLLHAIGHPDHP
ncbi:MAG: hypothetical protein RL266_2820 [Bacteroidota bacterium]